MSSNDILAIGLQAMQGDSARVQQISMNMANALTPGYKRGVPVERAITGGFARAMDSAATAPGTAPGTAAPLPGVSVLTDTRPGTLRRTGQALDLGLVGGGYFEIVTDKGTAYTRQGAFQLDSGGRLVTLQGHPVMGRDGDIRPGNANPLISDNGVVTDTTGNARGEPLAVLKVVHFEPGVQMLALGDGLFVPPEGAPAVSQAQTQVRQGFLENSNVNSAQEMTQLMQAMRHFESMHRVVQAHDEMMGSAIRRLGEMS